MAKDHFHLAWFLSQGYGAKSWRSMWPGSDLARWMMPDIFVDLAKGLERACFDYMIIEDSSMVPYTYKGNHDTYLKYAASSPKLDPAVLVPHLAMATKHLGLVPTLSTSEYPPYLLARLVNSLDHVTEGRIGWNCVTGSNDGAAQNYGHEGQRPHDDRYEVADEFADVVTRLWEAWEPDAVVRFLARTPHGYHDTALFAADVARAGYGTPARIDTVDRRSRADGPEVPARAYCQGTPLRNEILARDPAALERATEAATEAMARRFGRGPVDGLIRAHVVTAAR